MTSLLANTSLPPPYSDDGISKRTRFFNGHRKQHTYQHTNQQCNQLRYQSQLNNKTKETEQTAESHRIYLANPHPHYDSMLSLLPDSGIKAFNRLNETKKGRPSKPLPKIPGSRKQQPQRSSPKLNESLNGRFNLSQKTLDISSIDEKKYYESGQSSNPTESSVTLKQFFQKYGEDTYHDNSLEILERFFTGSTNHNPKDLTLSTHSEDDNDNLNNDKSQLEDVGEDVLDTEYQSKEDQDQITSNQPGKERRWSIRKFSLSHMIDNLQRRSSLTSTLSCISEPAQTINHSYKGKEDNIRRVTSESKIKASKKSKRSNNEEQIWRLEIIQKHLNSITEDLLFCDQSSTIELNQLKNVPFINWDDIKLVDCCNHHKVSNHDNSHISFNDWDPAANDMHTTRTNCNDIKVSETDDKSRYFVALELLETEQNYYNNLKMLIELYFKPMEQVMHTSSAIWKKKDLEKVFNPIKNLMKLSYQFQLELIQLITNWDVQQSSIGSIFVHMKHEWSSFIPYILNYLESLLVIDNYETNSELFVKLDMDAAKINPYRQTLRETMILPIQRLTRYMLLLEKIKKQTLEHHPDQNNLNEALNLINNIAVAANNGQKSDKLIDQQMRYNGETEPTLMCMPLQKSLANYQSTTPKNPGHITYAFDMYSQQDIKLSLHSNSISVSIPRKSLTNTINDTITSCGNSIISGSDINNDENGYRNRARNNDVGQQTSLLALPSSSSSSSTKSSPNLKWKTSAKIELKDVKLIEVLDEYGNENTNTSILMIAGTTNKEKMKPKKKISIQPHSPKVHFSSNTTQEQQFYILNHKNYNDYIQFTQVIKSYFNASN